MTGGGSRSGRYRGTTRQGHDATTEWTARLLNELVTPPAGEVSEERNRGRVDALPTPVSSTTSPGLPATSDTFPSPTIPSVRFAGVQRGDPWTVHRSDEVIIRNYPPLHIDDGVSLVPRSTTALHIDDGGSPPSSERLFAALCAAGFVSVIACSGRSYTSMTGGLSTHTG